MGCDHRLRRGAVGDAPRAGSEHVARLREVGLSDDEISDVAHAAAFFSWANRLMLTLGEPVVPAA